MAMRARRITPAQNSYLVEYMTSHSEFAAGRLVGQLSKRKMKRMWETLTQELNKEGPTRSVKQWMRAWADMKCRTRAKARNIGMKMAKTGNKTFKDYLNDWETKVLLIMGGESALGNSDLIESMGDSQNVVFDTATQQFDIVPTQQGIGDDDSKSDNIDVSEPMEDPIQNAIPEKATREFPSLSTKQDDGEGLSHDMIPEEATLEFPSLATKQDDGKGKTATTTRAPLKTKPSRSSSKDNQLKSEKVKQKGWNKERTPQEHFSRVKEEREKHEKKINDNLAQFFAVQNRQNDIQMLMAQSAMGGVDNEKARLEVERMRILQAEAQNATMISMTLAVKELASAMKQRQD